MEIGPNTSIGGDFTSGQDWTVEMPPETQISETMLAEIARLQDSIGSVSTSGGLLTVQADSPELIAPNPFTQTTTFSPIDPSTVTNSDINQVIDNSAALSSFFSLTAGVPALSRDSVMDAIKSLMESNFLNGAFISIYSAITDVIVKGISQSAEDYKEIKKELFDHFYLIQAEVISNNYPQTRVLLMTLQDRLGEMITNSGEVNTLAAKQFVEMLQGYFQAQGVPFTTRANNPVMDSALKSTLLNLVQGSYPSNAAAESSIESLLGAFAVQSSMATWLAALPAVQAQVVNPNVVVPYIAANVLSANEVVVSAQSTVNSLPFSSKVKQNLKNFLSVITATLKSMRNLLAEISPKANKSAENRAGYPIVDNAGREMTQYVQNLEEGFSLETVSEDIESMMEETFNSLDRLGLVNDQLRTFMSQFFQASPAMQTIMAMQFLASTSSGKISDFEWNEEIHESYKTMLGEGGEEQENGLDEGIFSVLLFILSLFMGGPEKTEKPVNTQLQAQVMIKAFYDLSSDLPGSIASIATAEGEGEAETMGQMLGTTLTLQILSSLINGGASSEEIEAALQSIPNAFTLFGEGKFASFLYNQISETQNLTPPQQKTLKEALGGVLRSLGKSELDAEV